MYELVNTSVPNGLIAGTHGFATVAMTKGMPDAIRTRVENFCAYPHRTSAHDESYFKENPVNWFHLTLPSGDHVVGRTAPCDFDYTGRTNRLARTITLKKGEMPQGGGVSALRLAGSRLAEKWNGEPRMLQPDKALAAQLFGVGRTGDSRPRNWISTFGERGEELARRTAILVAQNGVGKGKSVYFKTSTGWDVDGTKLLGLFGDIIELLPDEIASLVTFSTFSACVPSGTVCHLRGIYDKDRAFEVTSATQPWVDCENGRVVHEEMLPMESASAFRENGNAVEGADLDASANSPARIGIVVDSALNQRQAARNRANRWRGEILLSKESSDKMFYIVLGVLAAVVLCVAVGCYIWVKGSTTMPSEGADEIAKLMEEDMEEKEERARQEERAKIEREERAKKEREQAELKKQAEKEQQERRAAATKAAEAAAEARRLREQAEMEQKEDSKYAAEEIARARKNNLEVPLGKLKITKVIDAKKVAGLKEFEIYEKKKPDTDRYMLAVHASLVTNADSVIVYYAHGETAEQANCCYRSEYRKILNIPRTIYKIDGWPDASKDSPWAILRVVNPNWRKEGDARSLDLFWWWNEIPGQNLFAQNDSVDLKKICFGSDAAKDLYKTHGNKIYYLLEWDDKIWIQNDDAIQIKQFCDDNALDKLKAEYDTKIEIVKADIKNNETLKKMIESVLDDIKKGKQSKDDIEHGRGFGNDNLNKDDKKRKKSDEDRKIINSIKSLNRKKYSNLQASGIDNVERELKDDPQVIQNKIEDLKQAKGKLEREKEEKCDKKKLEEAVRKRVFQVHVADSVPEGMAMGLNKNKNK